MTPRELDALLAELDGLEAKATKGEWIYQDERDMTESIWIGAQHPEVGFVSHAEVRSGCTEADEIGDMEANAAFIVALRNAYPKLRAALASDGRDAARYRYLRAKRDRLHNGKPFIAITHEGGCGFSGWTEEHADKQVDAAIDALLGQTKAAGEGEG